MTKAANKAPTPPPAIPPNETTVGVQPVQGAQGDTGPRDDGDDAGARASDAANQTALPGAGANVPPAATSGRADSPHQTTPLDSQSDAELAARSRNRHRSGATSPAGNWQRPPRKPAPDDGEVRALITDGAGGYTARPDPTFPVDEETPVVRYNWVGEFEGRRAEVTAGTPAECLPGKLVEAILNTKHAVIAPRGPKPPPNPHAP